VISNRCWHKASCHLLPIDTWHLSLLYLVPQWDKCLDVCTNYTEAWYASSTTHMPCRPITQVRIKFLAPECWLPDFSETSLHFIVYLQTQQNTTHTPVSVISQTKHNLSYIDHPLCQIGSLLPCKMEAVSLVTATRLRCYSQWLLLLHYTVSQPQYWLLLL